MKTVSVEKKLVDKLVEQSTETIDEVKIAEITVTENIRKCSSCPLYIVLFLISLQSTLELLLIFFTTNTWIIIKNCCNIWLCLSSKKLLI